MSRASDLIRVAELIKLAAETAAALAVTTANGEHTRVVDIVQRLEAAADELAQLGCRLENGEA